MTKDGAPDDDDLENLAKRLGRCWDDLALWLDLALSGASPRGASPRGSPFSHARVFRRNRQH